MTKAELFDFMTAHKLGVLGYLSPQDTPRSALVGIGVTTELEIVFDTVSSSRKYGDLLANPAASFVIGWEGEVTVQLEGQAFQPTGAELAQYQQVYFAAWPECREHLTWPGIAYFVVRPQWIRYSDYDQRPPLIQEFSF
ncbi:MAG: pyridoxamine 5'-phosphate oxidase family protein [Bryobacteraceae bacterium]